MSVVRVVLAGVVIVVAGLVGGALRDHVSALVLLAYGVAAMFAVSAVIPHYMWRGEPLLPDRRKRR